MDKIGEEEMRAMTIDEAQREAGRGEGEALQGEGAIEGGQEDLLLRPHRPSRRRGAIQVRFKPFCFR